MKISVMPGFGRQGPEKSRSEEIDNHTVEGVAKRLASVARTLVDCFKCRNRIGLDVALEALDGALRDRKASRDEILRLARRFRMAPHGASAFC